MITFLKDSSGRNFDLTNVGGVQFDYGKFGYCANFGSGSTNKSLVYLGNVLSALTTPNNTFGFWVKMNTEIASGTQILFGYNSSITGGGQYTILYYLYNAGNRILRIQTILSGGNLNVDYSISLGTSNWYHIVCIKENTTTSKLYINGKLVASGTGSGINSSPSGSYNLTIGNGTSVNFGSSCKIDEFLIEERAWSAEEIRRYYTNSTKQLILQ